MHVQGSPHNSRADPLRQCSCGGDALCGDGPKNILQRTHEIAFSLVLPCMDLTDSTSIAEFIGQLRNLLTAIQLGEYLSISPKTIFQWAKQSRLPVIRMGSALRFDPRAIAIWLRERSATTRAAVPGRSL